jgi:aminoglycoside phosphotransferase (APT) family kinase protein
VIRSRPPEHTLRWASEAVGAGSRVTRVRRLVPGGWHANHALTIVDRQGKAHRLVLRRWARPEWEVDDPDFTPAREIAVLERLAGAPIPVPQVVAADPDGAICDVPALLLTRLPGRPPGLPHDMDAFLAQLAEALPAIHAIDGTGIPAYRRYHDPRSATPPSWSSRPALWERAIEVASGPPPEGPLCLIHRDYHPENTLWSRGRLCGIVDWTSGSWGSAAVDTAHMRWNLALTYGLDAADEFLRHHRSATSGALEDQHYWDLVTVLDLIPEIDPREWSGFDLARLDRYVERVVSEAVRPRAPRAAGRTRDR